MKKLLLLYLLLFGSINAFSQININIKSTKISPPKLQGEIEYDVEIINESQVNYESISGYIEVSNYEGKFGKTDEITIKNFDILDKEKMTFNIYSKELWGEFF